MDGAGSIGDPRLWLLFHWWRGKKAGRALPSPAGINLAELPRAVQPNTMMLELVRENGVIRFRYSHVGEVFWRSAGETPVGRFIDEILPEAAGYREYVVGIYHEMAVQARPMYTENQFILRHGQCDPMATKRVSLPLSHDGTTVDAVLAGHVFDYGTQGDDGLGLVTDIQEGVRAFLE